MIGNPLALIDRSRAAQFALLGSVPRLLRAPEIWTDADGVAWAGKRYGDLGFGVTWLGRGWVFDPIAAKRWADHLATQRQKAIGATDKRHHRELTHVLDRIQLGGLSERLLWIIHQSVLTLQKSVIRLPDHLLRTAVWGKHAQPQHWRKDLLRLLKGLSWLHLAEWADDEPPLFGQNTALLTNVADLRPRRDGDGASVGSDTADLCGPDCPGHLGPRHHHFQINIGRGFLGVLEQFAQDDGKGTRAYEFPLGGRKHEGPCLRKLGKTGSLISIFVPAKICEPSSCATFTDRQHRLLQALVRETMRANKRRRKSLSKPEIFTGNHVRVFHGKRAIPCGLLSQDGQYVGFNGNGVLKGHGYRLATEGGWLAKARYALTDVAGYLDDLAVLAGRFGLTVTGIDKRNQFFSLDDMRRLIDTSDGRRTLNRLHVRVYTGADYLERWTAVFQGAETMPPKKNTSPDGEAVTKLRAEMKRKRITGRALAAGIKRDHSFVAKLLTGKKRSWPKGMLKKAQKWVTTQEEPKPRPAVRASRKRRKNSGSVLDEALRLLDRGWSVVPQETGAKKPCVKWKPYQERLPTKEEWRGWSRKWPDAGLALVLGPVSGVFVNDVDGKEAHDTLMERLGSEPLAPKVRSGSGDPYRYHLYFSCPDLPTRAKQTPWHEHLEFRGKGGIVIIPPSLHKSGNRYEWVKGRSPEDMELPEAPPQILDALKPVHVARPLPVASIRRKLSVTGIDASPRTLVFLSGRWSAGPGWNQKLFNAACDLCGRDMSIEEAEPLLLAGAQPWNKGEEELALRTIKSAYSQPRVPGRL